MLFAALLISTHKHKNEERSGEDEDTLHRGITVQGVWGCGEADEERYAVCGRGDGVLDEEAENNEAYTIEGEGDRR